ncbi:MAG: hypothetical protein K0R92_963 [Lachnospiraceae bacterium]|jgi:release factor glutamine methyltransferase|nr:hypothetical protein [Lachnospiraceae bacterium]
MTLEDALKEGRTYLQARKIEDSDIDAWYLLSYFFNIKRADYLMHPDRIINKNQFDGYMNLILRRSEHIPLQYITREQEFMGLNFKVSEDVLIPRQDTEILVEEALKYVGDKDVLDMCTGSGCIIISLAKLGNIRSGMGIDISEKALTIARANAQSLNADVKFIQSNLFEEVRGKYDIVISNPPYIPTGDILELMEEVKNHEPIIALDGEEDGLFFYRTIIKQLRHYLKPSGYVFFEIGHNQGEAVSQLLKEHDYKNIKIIKDLAGLDRVVSGQSC